MRSFTLIFLVLWSQSWAAGMDYDYTNESTYYDYTTDVDYEAYAAVCEKPVYFRDISNLTMEVYHHPEDSDKVAVLCHAGTKINEGFGLLVIISGENVDVLHDPTCFAQRGMCMFNVSVSASTLFTCKALISGANLQLSSEAYVYHPQKTSPAYIAFASFIGVCLIVMVIIVIKITLWAKQQESLRTGQNVMTR